MWSGLGYNIRAKRIYESSKILAEKGFEEIYPNFELLPGVGQYTKNAILSFAYGDKVLAVDTNLERIITRYFGVDNAKDYVRKYSNLLLEDINSKDLNQAFMDFGSSVCTSSKAKCDICPLEKSCKKYFINPKKVKSSQMGGFEKDINNLEGGGHNNTLKKAVQLLQLKNNNFY